MNKIRKYMSEQAQSIGLSAYYVEHCNKLDQEFASNLVAYILEKGIANVETLRAIAEETLEYSFEHRNDEKYIQK